MSQTCPLCKNRGTVDPLAQAQDPMCEMCRGEGVVGDTSCACGRPTIYLDHQWRDYCNSRDCQIRCEGVKK